MLDINRKLIEQKFGEVFVSSGNEYKVRCETCGKKAKWVNPVKGKWKCFACGKGGSFQQSGVTSNKRKIEYRKCESVLPNNYTPLFDRKDFPSGWDYIIKRGFNPEKINAGTIDGMSLLFPCVEERQVVYYSTRAVFDVMKIKAGNATKNRTGGKGKEEFVYNIDGLHEDGLAIITEGVFSSFACAGQCIYGKTISDSQINKILGKKPSFIIMAYDTDAKSNIESAIKMFNAKGFKRVTGVYLQDDLDPADLGYKKLFEIISKKLHFLHQTGVLKLSGLSFLETEKLLQEKYLAAEQLSWQ